MDSDPGVPRTDLAAVEVLALRQHQFMHLSLRLKLFMIVGASALSLAVVIVSDLRLVRRQEASLQELEQRLVPKLELEPRLLAQFDQLGQALKDGVAAQDRAALEASDELRAGIDSTIERAGPALEPQQAQALRESVAAYHRLAINVSMRMLDGETGEALVGAMNSMQEQHQRTVDLIERVAGLDRATLHGGFATLHQTSAEAARSRLSVGLFSLTLVVALSVWLGRGALRSLARITDGFDRFARGKLDEPIVPASADELGTLAHEANRMAAALSRLSVERDAADWIRAGQVELAEKLGGDPDPTRAAQIALDVLSQRLDAVAAALYLEASDGWLERTATFAFSAPGGDPSGPAARFRLGEGLVGQAALDGAIRLVDDVPPGYASVRSGLGSAPPRCLVLVPLRRGQRSVGVVELGLFRSCPETARDFLNAVSESLATALESARSRARLRDLLEESQTLAARLSAQEEELVQSNHELGAQQEELRIANDELEAQRATLERRNGELEQTRARLQEKADELAKMSSYKSQFLANMSHELRTPLNSMLLLSQILSDNEAGNLSDKQVEHCRTIHSAGKGLLSLINQVLDLSKIEAGKQELSVEPVAIAEMAAQLGRTFEPQLSKKGLVFSVEIAPDVPAVILTDGQCLQRILINLLGNAMKFTERGSVSLRIARPEPDATFPGSRLDRQTCIAFAVSDTGVGIPPAIQERIFARFEQADARTVRRYGGTGLGLSIARESAQLMGGELRVQSVEGRGSTFTCFLPERMPPSDSARSAAAPSSRPPRVVADDRAQLGPNEPHLLIVEDDPIFAERLVETVRSLGLRAIVAMNGRQALRLARTRPPAGIVLDVKLPDTDGFALRAELRSDPRTAAIPVHFVSGLETPRGPFGLSAVGYLEKPASREAIVKAIQDLLRPEAAPSRVLVVEDDDAQSQSVVQLLARSKLEAVEARTADEAVGALERDRFGCVILDLGLPDADGLRLLEGLKARHDIALPPVVVHTARALSREETRLLRDYAEAVVLKEGFSSARLVDEVSTFVRQLEGKRSLPPATAVASALSRDDGVVLDGKTVLIADDDMRTVYALSALLRDRGADVVVAETGREALRALDEHADVGAVLMDIMMPDMDGYEAMRRVREQQRFADLPLIALTARAMKGERERCQEAGASDYLTKPVDPSGLLTALQHWLTRTPHPDTLS